MTVDALISYFYDIIGGTALPPMQVGVWIPKAKAGPTADHFRPLGMPNTIDRLVDGSIAAYIMRHTAHLMHPSQAVMSYFKEPQKAVSCIQRILDGDSSACVLLADLSKAFERVNPYWILALLRIRKAPAWLIAYTKFVLFHRRVTHKVQGRLLPSRTLRQGVDMGRSFSVYLFCLAMDPLFTYLNQIPGVLAVQGYVDDTTIAELRSLALRRIEATRFGIQAIRSHAPSLGLALEGRFQLLDDGSFDRAAPRMNLEEFNPAPARKMFDRLKSFSRPTLSIVARCTGYNTFILSVMPFSLSYFGLTSKDLNWLRQAASKYILKRKWIEAEILPYILRYVGITTLLDPALSAAVAALGLYL